MSGGGGGGTEAFPDLGRHCQHADCRQLDFLPFTCNACRKVFCLEHRSYSCHNCPRSDLRSRKVVICETCSTAIETTGLDAAEEDLVLREHGKNPECDPRKKKKPRCAARRCKETLTFSNNCVCRLCGLKLCLSHRFPEDHACQKASPAAARGLALAAIALRNGKDCAKNGRGSTSPTGAPSVKAY